MLMYVALSRVPTVTLCTLHVLHCRCYQKDINALALAYTALSDRVSCLKDCQADVDPSEIMHT